ncbi:hypothetical protein D3C86_927620 [compost metagenome]
MAIQERRVLIALMQATDTQGRLKADQVVSLCREACRRLFQLQGIRVVLGVIDRQELTPGHRKRMVERAGLGGRDAGRRHQNLKPVGTIDGLGGGDGGLIVRFQHQIAVQQGFRVVQA